MMDWKWLKTAQLFDDDAGGDATPAGAHTDGEIKTDSGADPAAEEGLEPSPPSTAPPSAPVDSTGPPAPPPNIGFPDALDRLFNPQPSQSTGPPPAAPSAPPPPASPPPPSAVRAPNADLMMSDPERYHQEWEAYMEHRIQAGVDRALGEVDKQGSRVEEISNRMNHERFQAVNKMHKRAEGAIRDYWENYFSRDADFRGDPELQGIVQDIIGYYADTALNNAYNQGQIGGLEEMTTPIFAKRVLALAKAEKTIAMPAMRPGHELAGPQPPAPPKPKLLDEVHEDALEAARKEGWRYTEEQLAEAVKAKEG